MVTGHHDQESLNIPLGRKYCGRLMDRDIVRDNDLPLTVTDRYKIRQVLINGLCPFYETTKSIFTGRIRMYFGEDGTVDRVINYETGRICTASASYAWRGDN